MKSSRAFTLIELLIVVAIIAILAAIAVPNFLEAHTRAKVSRIKSDFRTVFVAMESYNVDNQKYPPDPDEGGTPADAGWTSRILWRLSTPVAYVTSIPQDAWTWKESTWPLTYGEQYFIYTMENQVGGPGQVTFGFDKNAKWLLCSVGPDSVFDSYHCALDNRKYLYDPTNGTVSFGDLVLSGSSGFTPANAAY